MFRSKELELTNYPCALTRALPRKVKHNLNDLDDLNEFLMRAEEKEKRKDKKTRTKRRFIRWEDTDLPSPMRALASIIVYK